MSLINQMLKDLEKRKAEADSPQELPKTIQIVDEVPSRGLPWGSLAAALIFVALAGVGYWRFFPSESTLKPPVAPVAEAGQAVSVPVIPEAPPKPAVRPKPVEAEAMESSPPTGVEPVNSVVAAPSTPESKGSEQVPVERAPAAIAQSKPIKSKPLHRSPRRATYIKSELADSSKSGTADDHYSTALRLLEAGRELEAREELEATLRDVPEHAEAQRLLAKSYVASGQYHRAEALLGQQGGDPAASNLRAQLYLKEGKTEQAEQALKAIRDDEDDPNRLAVKGALRQQQGRYGEAAEYYTRAIKMQPSQSKWWLGLAISLEGNQRYQEAIGAYQRVLDAGVANGEVQRYVESRLSILRGGH